MGLPNIIIEFKTKPLRLSGGKEALLQSWLLKKQPWSNKIEDKTQVPADLTAENKEYVERAFEGGKAPIKYVLLIRTDTVENASEKLETIKFDYLAATPAVAEEETQKIATQIKTMRDSKRMKVKAVLPNIAADHEGILTLHE